MFDCRVKSTEYPSIDEVVIIIVDKKTDVGFYVRLPEYNFIEGLVTRDEITRRKTSQKLTYIQQGYQCSAMVLRVDSEKKYVDLSIKSVKPDDNEKCLAVYAKEKFVHSIMRKFSQQTQKPIFNYYEKYIWGLDEMYGNSYDAFKLLLSEKEKIFDSINFDNEERDILYEIIIQKMQSKIIKAYSEISITAFTTGIETIKNILKIGQINIKHPSEKGGDTSEVLIRYVGSPIYSLSTSALDGQCAVQTLVKSIEIMENESKKYEAEFIVKTQPYIVEKNK